MTGSRNYFKCLFLKPSVKITSCLRICMRFLPMSVIISNLNQVKIEWLQIGDRIAKTLSYLRRGSNLLKKSR